MTPSVGRIVHYMLSQNDAEQINRRRTSGASIAERIPSEKWPIGAQAHIGNRAEEGQVYPMLIVRVWSATPNDVTAVQGQVFLDGNDVFWATSVSQVPSDISDDQKRGRWFAPPRA
jgi:hypothetical protein